MFRLRSLKEIVSPELEPVSLTEAKAQVGLLPEQMDDDALLLRLVSTGRQLVEQRLGITLAARQLRASYVPEVYEHYLQQSQQQYRRPGLAIPVPPILIDGTHPLLITVAGVTINAGTYSIDADSTPAVIRFTVCPAFSEEDPLVVTYWSGPSPGSRIQPAAETVILLYVAHGFKSREGVLTGTTATSLPMGIETLLASISITGAY